MNRSDLENRIRKELENYPSPNPTPNIFDCWESEKKRIVIGRWRWFWKRIQFWRYRVIRIPIDDIEDGQRYVKALWRFK